MSNFLNLFKKNKDLGFDEAYEIEAVADRYIRSINNINSTDLSWSGSSNKIKAEKKEDIIKKIKAEGLNSNYAIVIKQKTEMFTDLYSKKTLNEKLILENENKISNIIKKEEESLKKKNYNNIQIAEMLEKKYKNNLFIQSSSSSMLIRYLSDNEISQTIFNYNNSNDSTKLKIVTKYDTLKKEKKPNVGDISASQTINKDNYSYIDGNGEFVTAKINKAALQSQIKAGSLDKELVKYLSDSANMVSETPKTAEQPKKAINTSFFDNPYTKAPDGPKIDVPSEMNKETQTVSNAQITPEIKEKTGTQPVIASQTPAINKNEPAKEEEKPKEEVRKDLTEDIKTDTPQGTKADDQEYLNAEDVKAIQDRASNDKSIKDAGDAYSTVMKESGKNQIETSDKPMRKYTKIKRNEDGSVVVDENGKPVSEDFYVNIYTEEELSKMSTEDKQKEIDKIKKKFLASGGKEEDWLGSKEYEAAQDVTNNFASNDELYRAGENKVRYDNTLKKIQEEALSKAQSRIGAGWEKLTDEQKQKEIETDLKELKIKNNMGQESEYNVSEEVNFSLVESEKRIKENKKNEPNPWVSNAGTAEKLPLIKREKAPEPFDETLNKRKEAKRVITKDKLRGTEV